MLVTAKNPVIIADRCARSQADVKNLVALAEALQVPVIDKLGRMNFPTNHYLNGSAAMQANADLILALDPGDLWSYVDRLPESIARVSIRTARPDCKVISIDSELLVGAGNYQDKQRFYQADLPIAADSATTLPLLLAAVNSAMSAARRNENPQREAAMREAFYLKRQSDMAYAAIGWDSQPISVARMCMELYNAIKGDEWSLVSPQGFESNWPSRLWDFTDYGQFHGGSGAAGIGYIGGAAIGAALGHRDNGGRLCVSLQGDGDFLMGPGAMWTAAHHRIPLLMIIHNNRAWYQETMSVQILASRRDRHPERGRIGTEIVDPNINYAKIAEGFGVYAEPQITHPRNSGRRSPVRSKWSKAVTPHYSTSSRKGDEHVALQNVRDRIVHHGHACSRGEHALGTNHGPVRRRQTRPTNLPVPRLLRVSQHARSRHGQPRTRRGSGTEPRTGTDSVCRLRAASAHAAPIDAAVRRETRQRSRIWPTCTPSSPRNRRPKTRTASRCWLASTPVRPATRRAARSFMRRTARSATAERVRAASVPSCRARARAKMQAAVAAFVKTPAGSMPKLYPGMLSESDVTAVAAYVETLK